MQEEGVNDEDVTELREELLKVQFQRWVQLMNLDEFTCESWVSVKILTLNSKSIFPQFCTTCFQVGFGKDRLSQSLRCKSSCRVQESKVAEVVSCAWLLLCKIEGIEA